MKMKKLIFMALILAMTAVPAITGCANNNDSQNANTDVTTEAASDTVAETEISDELPEKDYESYSFKMLIRNDNGWVEDMYAEQLNGEIMNDAIYNRNTKVGERFNVTFEVIRSSDANYDTDGLKAILAGDDAYDIIIPHARGSFAYAVQNVLLEWNTQLPYVNLDKPWWDQDAKNSFSINHKLFMMIGDISYKNLGVTNAMLFNKNMFDDLGIQYPYQVALDNKWTFDKFTEYAKQGTRDLNGDGKISFKDGDVLGYVTSEWTGPIQVLYSGNQRIVSKDENDLPYLSLNTPTTVEVFTKFFEFLDSGNGYCEPWQPQDSSLANGVTGKFVKNEALFLDSTIRGTIFLRDMDANFGILPWPKFNETIDKYYSNVDAGCNLIIVPVTAADPERTSIILEALAAEGYKTVVPAYFDVALSTKYSRDDESAAMLEIVRSTRVYDLGYYDMNLGTLNSIGQYMFSSKGRDFASLYAKNEKPANKSLEKTIAAYEKE